MPLMKPTVCCRSLLPAVRYCLLRKAHIHSSTGQRAFLISLHTHHRSLHEQISSRYSLLGLAGLSLIVFAAENESPSTSVDDLKELSEADEKAVMIEADMLYSQNQTDNLYEFLKGYTRAKSAEVHWRLARAAYDKSKHCDAKSNERKAFVYEAFGYAQSGLSIDETCGACHRWYGILLNDVSDYEGIKQKIKNSYIVKDHFKKAISLNPKDATSMYALGRWCFFVADMSWYTQKVASVIFATPPTSNFQEALDYFLMAESVDPDFFSLNHLMIAKTYLKLNDKAKAKEHLVKARDLPIRSIDDKNARAESVEMLGQI